jgi:hypothetical protein
MADLTLEIFGHKILEEELRVAFEVDTGRERIDLVLWHPTFADLGERAGKVALMVLDGAFGEDGVERWLGGIETVADMPADAVPFSSLRQAVADLEVTATGEAFALLEGFDDAGHAMVAMVNQALKRIDHPELDMFVAIKLHLLHPNEHGFPEAAESETLNALEAELLESLGSQAAYFGRITCAGARIFHFFAAEGSGAAAAIEQWTARHPDHKILSTWQRDERWDALRMFG